MATFSVLADGNGFSFNTLTPAYTGDYSDAHSVDVSSYTTDISATGSSGSPVFVYRPMDLSEAVKLFWTLSSVNVTTTVTAGDSEPVEAGPLGWATTATNRLTTRTDFRQDVANGTYTEDEIEYPIQALHNSYGPSSIFGNVTNLREFTGAGSDNYGISFANVGLFFAQAIAGGPNSAAEYMILSNIIRTPPTFTSTNWTISNITLGGIPFLLGRIDLGTSGNATSSISTPSLSFL